MNVIKAVTCLMFFMAVGGCATNSTREKLERADRSEQIVLTEKVAVVARSPIGVCWEYVALPGTYDAERKDTSGVYFFGSERSIVEISELYKNQLRLKIGGLYLPNETSKPPRLFYIFETDVHTTESIDRYIQERTLMSLTVPGMDSGRPGSTIVGNALGGAIVHAIIESGAGQIMTVAVDPDPEVSTTIRGAVRPTQFGRAVDARSMKNDNASKQ